MAALNELSEREREILRLVATGASNKQIAQRLAISPNTVKVHLRNIFDKLQVTSRTEAALCAIRHGLAGEPLATGEPTAGALDRPAPRPQWLRAARLFGLLGALALALLAGWVLLSAAPSNPPPPPLARWQPATPLPEGRAGMAAAVYQNTLLLFGGETSAGVSAQTLRYLPAEGSYTLAARLPQAVTLAQAAALGERIYLPGGRAANGAALDLLAIYDPRQDAWSLGGALPEARYGYALAAQDGYLYLFGGTDGQSFRREVYRYDPERAAWRRAADLPEAVAFAAAVPLAAGRILLAGGKNQHGALDAVWVYYPQRDLNGEAAWQPRAALPQPRYGMGLAALAGAVYLMGGNTAEGEPAPPPLSYDPLSDTWTAFEVSPQPGGLYPALLAYETHLHLLGGVHNGELLSGHQRYQAIFTIVIPVMP